MLYENPNVCLTYYGGITIAYESVNKFKDGAKEIIEMMMVASSATRNSAITSLFASMDSTMTLVSVRVRVRAWATRVGVRVASSPRWARP